MNYKSTDYGQEGDLSESRISDINLSFVDSMINKRYNSINAQWERIIQSPDFKNFSNLDCSSDLFYTNFPNYIVFLINDYYKKKSKANYFNACFSRNENQSKINAICEASAFITATSKQLPPILLSDQFLYPIIDISISKCGFPALMSLKTLLNISENSYESSKALLNINVQFLNIPENSYETSDINILSIIFNLAQSSNDNQIRQQALFLISSFAKFDHGDEVANSIFSFFFSFQQLTEDLFNISLRAFSLLSQHHNHLFNKDTFVNKPFELIQMNCDILNSQCFTVLINLIRFNSQILDVLFNLGIFRKIYEILTNNFSNYCIDFLEAALITSRNYDEIVFSQEFMSLYEYFFKTESNHNKIQIGKLFAISFSSCSQTLISRIICSNIFKHLFDLVSSNSQDFPYIKEFIIGVNRLFTLFDNDCDHLDDLKEEFYEVLQENQFTDDRELNILVTQSLMTNYQQN